MEPNLYISIETDNNYIYYDLANTYDEFKLLKIKDKIKDVIITIDGDMTGILIDEWLDFIKNDLNLPFSINTKTNELILMGNEHTFNSLKLLIKLISYIDKERNTILKTFKWLKDNFDLNPIELLQYSHYCDTNNSTDFKDQKILTFKEYKYKIKKHNSILYGKNNKYHVIKNLIIKRDYEKLQF